MLSLQHQHCLRRTDGRTDDGQLTMTLALWPLACRAKNEYQKSSIYWYKYKQRKNTRALLVKILISTRLTNSGAYNPLLMNRICLTSLLNCIYVLNDRPPLTLGIYYVYYRVKCIEILRFATVYQPFSGLKFCLMATSNVEPLNQMSDHYTADILSQISKLQTLKPFSNALATTFFSRTVMVEKKCVLWSTLNRMLSQDNVISEWKLFVLPLIINTVCWYPKHSI